MTAVAFFLIVLCIVAEIAREIFFKIGVMKDEADPVEKSWLWMVVSSPWIVAGLVLWAIEIVIWIKVLETTPLHIAFPIMSLIYVGLPIASQTFLKEKMTGRQWGGAALICAGVAVIGLFGTG